MTLTVTRTSFILLRRNICTTYSMYIVARAAHRTPTPSPFLTFKIINSPSPPPGPPHRSFRATSAFLLLPAAQCNMSPSATLLGSCPRRDTHGRVSQICSESTAAPWHLLCAACCMLTCRQRRPQRQRCSGYRQQLRILCTLDGQLRLFAVGPHTRDGVLLALRCPQGRYADLWRRQADPTATSGFELRSAGLVALPGRQRIASGNGGL